MVKVKNASTFGRIYDRVFVCMKCNAKLRTDNARVLAKSVKCRRCGYKGLRAKSKEIKKV